MIQYLIIRAQIALKRHGSWLLAPVALTAGYLAMAYFRPSQFRIETRVPVPASLKAQGDVELLGQLGLAVGPGSLLPPGPQLVYGNVRAPAQMTEIGFEVGDVEDGTDWRDLANVRKFVRGFEVKRAGDDVVIGYDGESRASGEKMISFLAVQVGQRFSQMSGAASATPAPAPKVTTAGTGGRLPEGAGGRATVFFLIAMLVTLVVMTLTAAADRRFATETEVARHLGLPVLGRLPKAKAGAAGGEPVRKAS